MLASQPRAIIALVKTKTALAAAALTLVLAPAARVGSPFLFEDITPAAGIRFRGENGATADKLILETMGSGLGWLDYDGDGRLDLVFVNGGGRPGSAAAKTDRLALYRNDGNGRFADVTGRARLNGSFDTYGLGVAAADYDNDGDTDFLLTGYPRSVLFRNNGDGTFTDMTARAANLNQGELATSAGWFDYDRDGRLDLLIANYVSDFSWDRAIYCGEKRPGYRAYCHPDVYKGASPRLYRNLGDGRFEDVTARAKVLNREGKGLGVALADFNDDGWPDIFVANDGVRNFLYWNRGNGEFEEAGVMAGVGFSEDGEAEAGMGVDAADVDGDLRPDLYVTHLDFELNRLYANLGGEAFADRTRGAGLSRATYFYSGFGVKLADFDNSGRRHILIANGHILDNIHLFKSEVAYREPMVLLENDGTGKFRDASGEAGEIFQRKLVGRGLAVADFDDDGRLDFAASQNFGPPLLARNAGRVGRWIKLRLEGTGASNRDAIGARVVVTAGGRQQAAEVVGGSSYCSAQDLRLHIGLGAAERLERIEVRWPSGRRETFRNVEANRVLRLVEGAAP